MAFIQVIDFETDDIDGIRALDGEWSKAAASNPNLTARRAILCADRDRPGHYVNLVFFDSYESAMKNSEDPFTQEMAGKMGAFAKGEPKFYNLDVNTDESY